MEINSDGIIRADIMTARIEDKNLLTKKGDIYVGTGATTSYDGTDVYQTKAMNIQAAITEDVQREKGSHSLNLGAGTFNGVNAISLGYNANVSADGAISLGYNANVSAANAVQIGAGTNNVANSLQFRDRVVVDGNKKIFGDAVDAKEISSFADMMFFDVTGNEISNKEFAFYVKDKDIILEEFPKIVLPAHSSGVVVSTQESSRSDKVLNIMYITKDRYVGHFQYRNGVWFKCYNQLFKHMISLQSSDNGDGVTALAYFTIFNYSSIEINTVKELKKYMSATSEMPQYSTSAVLYKDNINYNIVGVYLNSAEEIVFSYFSNELNILKAVNYTTKNFTMSDTILSIS